MDSDAQAHKQVGQQDVQSAYRRLQPAAIPQSEVRENSRNGFLYWSDDGDLMALRVGNSKVTFMEQRSHGLNVWREPMVPLRAPKLYNLRSDPFERGDEDGSVFYDKWMADRAFMLVPAQAIVSKFLKTFQELPPRQKPASFSIDQALEKAWEKQETMAAAAPVRKK